MADNFTPDLWRTTYTSQRVDRHDVDIKDIVDSQSTIGYGNQTRLTGGTTAGSGTDEPDIPEGGTTEPTGGTGWDPSNALAPYGSILSFLVHGNFMYFMPSTHIVYALNLSSLTVDTSKTINLQSLGAGFIGICLSSDNMLAAIQRSATQYVVNYRNLPAGTGGLTDTINWSSLTPNIFLPKDVFDRRVLTGNDTARPNTFSYLSDGTYSPTNSPDISHRITIPSGINVTIHLGATNGIFVYYHITNTSSVTPNNYVDKMAIGKGSLTAGTFDRNFITYDAIVPHLPSGWTVALVELVSAYKNNVYVLVNYYMADNVSRHVLINFGQMSATGQVIEWSNTNYNLSSQRYELTYDKNTSGAAEHRISKFPISIMSRQVPDLGAGGTTSLSYSEPDSSTNIGGLLDTDTNFGVLLPATAPVGTYNGILAGTAAALGSLPSVTGHRNTRLSIIDTTSGTTSKAPPPTISPVRQDATAYASDTGAREIARFAVSVPGITNPRVVAEIAEGDTSLWSVDAVAASIDGSTELYVRLYQTWATARTNLEDTYRVKVDFHTEQVGKTNSDDTQGQVDITINTGSSTSPTTRYFPPRINPDWSVPTTRTVQTNTSETASLTGAFITSQNRSITSVQVNVIPASRSLATATLASDESNFVMRFLNTTGKASIQIRGYDGMSWSPWKTIYRNVVAATGSDNNAGMWIKRSGETNAVPMDNHYSFNVPEGQAKTRLFADDELYFSCARAAQRTLEIDLEFYGDAATGSIVRETDGTHAFTTAAGSLTGLRFKLFSVATGLDYETIRSVRIRVAGTGSRYTAGGTTWEEAEDEFYITLNVTNVNEPPSFVSTWINQYLSADGKLHIPSGSTETFSTAGAATDDGDNNALLTMRTAVSPSTSTLSASWARGTGTALGDGTLTLTAGSQQTAETTLQLTWYDGNMNSTALNVTVVIDASDKITPTANISATDTGISIAENSAVGTTLGDNLTAYFNSTNLQVVFGAASLEVSGDGAAYVNAEFVGVPGDANSVSRIRTTYQIKRTLKKSPDFEVYGAVGKTVTITIRSAGSHNTNSVTASYSFTLSVTDVTELVRRNAVVSPDHTFVIDLALARGGTLPHWDLDPTVYFTDDDPDDSRPVTYTHNEVLLPNIPGGDRGVFTIQDVTVGGKKYIRFTPRSALINGSPQSRDYEIHANQQGGVQSTPARGTITVNPYAPRPLRSHYPSPISFVHEYINATETSTDFEIASHYTNLDNRPVRFGFNTDFDQTASDSVAQYTFVTKSDGTIIARATRQATYTPGTETFHTSRIIYVGTTDPATPSVIPIYYGLTVSRPSS